MNIHILDVRLRDFHSPPIYLEIDELEQVVACPACDSKVKQECVTVAEGETHRSLSLSSCATCAHVYLSNRPNAEWFQRYYAEDWDTGSWARKIATKPLRTRIRRSTALTRVVRAARVLRHDLPDILYPWPSRFLHMVAGLGDAPGDEFPRGKKLLEIGTGYGQAISYLKDAGFETYGTEANAHRVAACREQGLKVFQTPIDDFEPIASFAPFDFVFSAHVFEHLTDLAQIMRSLKPLVADGGFIYIEVPHGPVSEDVMLRTHIPVHNHVFSATSMSALLKRFGFQPVRILADVNLHVVAQKDGPTLTLGDLKIPAAPAHMVHGLDVVASESEPLLVRYDQFRVEISRKIDGMRLYTRSFPYGVMPTSDTDRNEFTIQIEPDSEVWPIRFQHSTEQAPIWVKNG